MKQRLYLLAVLLLGVFLLIWVFAQNTTEAISFREVPEPEQLESFQDGEGYIVNGKLLTVYMEEVPNGGYSIKVDRIVIALDHTKVYVTETAPGKGCMVTQAFERPMVTVEVDRQVSGSLDIVRERKTKDCS